MNLILPFTRIFGPIIESLKNIFRSLGEIKEARRIEKKKVVQINFVEKTGIVTPLKGKLDSMERFLFLPDHDRVFFVDKEHYDEKLRRVFYVSANYHRTIDLDDILGNKGKLKATKIRIPNTENIKKYNRKKNPPKYKDLDLTNYKLELTLDLNSKDTEKAKDFSIESFKVLNTKMLEIFEDVPHRTILIVLVFGILIGMVLNSAFAFGILAWMMGGT